MLVVSDNSPLQYLILIDCIGALPSLYGTVITTPQVMDELLHDQTPHLVRVWAETPPAWLKIASPAAVDFLDVLDVGEATALSLAREWQADLVLIDERAGTDLARRVGIQPLGTLGVLIEAGVHGLIDFEISLTKLTAGTSFYASAHLIEVARRVFADRRAKQVAVSPAID